MITVKQVLKISAIIDKLDIKINNPDGKSEEIGADIILQIASKAHRASKELIDFIVSVKNCTIEDAENTDIITFVKEFVDTDIVSFFKSAVKAKANG